MTDHSAQPGLLPLDHAPLRVEVLRGAQGFEALRVPWQAALARMSRPSLFITPQFLALSCQHLYQPRDEPWFVGVYQGAELVGLLPLMLTRDPQAKVLRKVLVHMGQQGGDRPGIVHTIEPARVWAAALQALVRLRRHWHVLDLRELDAEGPEHLQGGPCELLEPLGQHGLQSRMLPCTHAGYLRIEGSWDDYLASRSRNTRQAYRRNERRLQEAHPDVRIDVVSDPAQIEQAVDRYLAIDAKSWKHAAGIEFWSGPGERIFLKALLLQLARQGQASVWLLAAGQVDMAGLVRLRQGSIMYERCSTYDPAYARFSPSTYLCMAAVRQLFAGYCDESDVMGLPQPMDERPAIQAWYPGERRTWRLLSVNLPLWWRPVYQLKAWLGGLRQALRAALTAGWTRPIDAEGATALPDSSTPGGQDEAQRMGQAIQRVVDGLGMPQDTRWPAAGSPQAPAAERAEPSTERPAQSAAQPQPAHLREPA